MSIGIWICGVIGILSMLYFLICLSYAGLSASFTVVWLVISGLALGCFGVLNYMVRHQITMNKWIRSVILLFVVIGIAVFVYAQGCIFSYSNQVAPANVEYLIVLGARVNGTTITGCLEKRLSTTLKYLQENEETVAIVTGGQGPGESITEAEAMKQYLVTRGIPESRIIKEEKATNTYENIAFSKEIIQNEDATVAIVTNGFHMYRAVNMARRQGMTNIYGHSAPTDRIMAISYYTREAIAILKYKLTGQI